MDSFFQAQLATLHHVNGFIAFTQFDIRKIVIEYRISSPFVGITRKYLPFPISGSDTETASEYRSYVFSVTNPVMVAAALPNLHDATLK